MDVAVSNAFVPVVEHLVKRGANVDLKGRHPDASARELAAAAYARDAADPAIRRIFEVCCGTPEPGTRAVVKRGAVGSSRTGDTLP